MPDHLHLLLTTGDLPKAMQHIRSGFSHRLASKRGVWQRGYTDRRLLTRDDLEIRRAYIHPIPARARQPESEQNDAPKPKQLIS